MSENVKINIIEKDNTSPAGSGIDSTDIAFIPGFSVLPDAPKNTPTLVTSTREFEKLFGTKPRVLTTLDTKSYNKYGFVAGTFDRSYVYAKELLYQGMPVLYSNIVDENNYQNLTINEGTLSILSQTKCMGISQDASNNSIVLTSAIDREDEEITLQFSTSFGISEAGTSTFEYTVVSNDCSIVSCKVDPESFKNIDSRVIELSDTQYEFVSSAAEEISKISVSVVVNVTMNKGDKVSINVLQPTSSALDVFYGGESPIINNQWEISTAEAPINNTISDKSVYSVKYITSGGYPSVVSKDSKSASQKFAAKMLAAAAHRGDAVALIDYQLSPDENVFAVGLDAESFYSKIHAALADISYSEYGAAMYPWSSYNCGSTLSFTDAQVIEMPASFGYLMCVAKAIKTSPNWLAMAGVTRGIVPGIKKLLVPGNVISNAIAEEMQPKYGVENHKISINTITNIRPYGLTLWGNRTLKPVSKDGTVALNFLNTRNMLSDIKKLLYTTAKSCMFEQNSDDLWLKFKDGIRPLLDRLKAGNGISDYKIVRGTTRYNGDPLTKGEIAAVIKIYPMYAVEYFELAVEINDEEVTVD